MQIVTITPVKKLFYLFSLFLMTSCSHQEKQKVPTVLVTVSPYLYFVNKIAGDFVHVEVVVPANANPHIYEPTPKQMKEILNTTLWFRLGEPIETKVLDAIREKNKDLQEIHLTSGISLISEGEGHGHPEEKDLHIWLSPQLAQIQAKTIARALIAAYPKHQQAFEIGLVNLLKELQDLDHSLQEELLPFKGEAILVSHPAFGYFCKEFHLQQLSIECEGKDPLPKDVEQILTQAKDLKVRKIFTQAQYNNKGALLIAKELGLPVHEVDPYSAHYIENLRSIAGLIIHE